MGEGLNKQRLFVNRERSWLSHVDEQSIMPINLFNLFDAFWTDPSSLVWWSLIRWSGDSVIVNPVFPGNPSVTQSLFRLFSLLWNIPCPFLHHNRSKYNFKPSYSNLILRANWLVWCLNRIYQLNQSRSRFKCSLVCYILSLAYMRNRPHKHTHTNKKETVCLMTSAHPTFIPHNVFSIPITTNAQVFLSHNCPKIKENLFQKCWKFT